ncbi:Anp1-domain-containing protein [Rhodotorula diobovata]|uniref:Anp1-domain-containing protein n=1 Tax=Rhodotorula diobovata TaxID=5288 RepID=A0A5C5G430_9BASI|nr:Anp1-domain-containing protein [Rhodotorula diobovata]
MARSAHLLRGSGGSAEERNPLVGLLTSRVALCLVSILVTLAFTGRSIGPCGSGAASTSGTDIASFDLTPIQATAQGAAAGEKLLVLTPLKDAAPWLDEYFENLARLSYPRNLISLAFLVSDSSDNTVAKLRARARRLAKLPPDERYDSITILEKDFHFNLASVARHGFEGQPVRRNFIARARNYLLTAALRWDHAWVLWLDVDVVRYDPDILSDLQSIDKDIVVPNTLWHLPKTWDFWGFDRNNFAETEESLALLDKLGPDVMLVEGYRELMTSRAHLVDMPTHLGLAHVPLDGIGCTFALVKAHVHREGVTFPTFVFDNEVETEGFAKVAKRAGFEVVGVPGILVFHAQNH